MRLILACALLLAPFAAQARSLTLTNLKPPVAKSCPGVAKVTTVAAFWAQLAACAAPAPTPAPTPSAPAFPQAPAPDLALPFALAKGLQPSWGTGAIPGLYTPDRSEGAFRFTCGGDGPINYDDPVVYPGRPGAAHGHLAWGNFDFTAFSTPETLAASAKTNCNASPFSLNRSLYWMPWLENDQGQVIRPDLVSVYYKRATKGGKFCDPRNPAFIGICTGLPNRIKFIFGWDMTRPTARVEGAWWYCTGGTGRHYPDLDAVFASGCKPGDTLVADTVAPNCWDGKALDSADHRSHMAYADYSRGDGMAHCPASHPYLIPQEENKAMWTVTADMIAAGGRSRVRLASDHMLPGAKPGQTLHADYVEAWDARAKAVWEANCIDKGLDCSGGDMGDGTQLPGANMPSYGWVHPQPRVKLPGRTGAAGAPEVNSSERGIAISGQLVARP